MHQLVLHAQVGSQQYDQVVKVLAGVTAQQPVNICEQSVIFQQLKPNQLKQAKTLSCHTLARDVDLGSNSAHGWRLVAADFPEAGVKNVTSRAVLEKAVEPDGLALFQQPSEWYKQIGQYLINGTRFVQRNVVVKLYRIYEPIDDTPVNVVEMPPPTTQGLRIFDKSGTYVVEAYVTTEDDVSSTTRETALTELLAFAKELEGVIDFRVPDRLSMDTRVKGT